MRCNVYLALKVVWYKLYGNLQFLLVSTYCWKDLPIDFVIELPILTNKKKDSYDSIFVTVK